MLTEADLREALRDCYDAAIPCNIVDLGLVYAIAFRPEPDAPGAGIAGVPLRFRVSVSVLSTSAAEQNDTEVANQRAAKLTAQIENRLAAFETVYRTEVTLLREPVWSAERISAEGRRLLAAKAAASAPSLVQIKLL